MPIHHIPTIRTRAFASEARLTRLAQAHEPVLSVKHFVQRSRALALYRDIVRTTSMLNNPGLEDELRVTARAEFERNRNVMDLTQIRYLISTGKTELDDKKRYFETVVGRRLERKPTWNGEA